MKIPYLALSALTLVLACKKEDKPEEEIYDTRYVSSVVSTKDSTYYEYNADHKLMREAKFLDGLTDSANSYISFLQYNGEIVTGINFTHDLNNTTGTPQFSFLYNEDNRTAKLVAQNGKFYDSIIYNAQGQIIERYFIEIPYSVKYHTKLTWKDGNVIKVVRNAVQTNIPDVLTYTYDNHPNMFIHRNILILTLVDKFHHLSKNNVTRIDYDLGANQGSFIQSEVFTYDYDDYGYPSKMLFSVGFIQDGDTTSYFRDDSSRINYLP